MTTFIEERVYYLLAGEATVTALVGARIYPDKLKQACAMPAIAYTRISTRPVNDLGGYDDTNQVNIQIDCYATTKAGAMDLAKVVLAAMDSAAQFNSLRIGWRTYYESDTRLYRNMVEFDCWNDTD